MTFLPIVLRLGVLVVYEVAAALRSEVDFFVWTFSFVGFDPRPVFDSGHRFSIQLLSVFDSPIGGF